jgi:hypothetical protein
MLGAALRIAVVAAGVAAALGSAAPQQPLQASYYTNAQPTSTKGCEDACDQITACQLGTFEPCFQQCRDSRIEQQRGGPERLAATARATCEDLAARMQPAQPNDPTQPPLPTFGDSPSATDPIPPPVAPPVEPPR